MSSSYSSTAKPIDLSKYSGGGFWIFRYPPNNPLVNLNQAGRTKYWAIESGLLVVIAEIAYTEIDRLFFS